MAHLYNRPCSLRRTQLITPCDDAWDMMNKAARSKTDIVRLELEDGVVPARKAEARKWCLRGLREIDWGGKEVWVRITHFDHGFAEDDIDTLVQGQPNVILMGKAFWQGLLDWIVEQQVGNQLVSPEDLDLIQVFDDPSDVVEAIFDFYQSRGFTPTDSEREQLLHL